LCHQFFCFLFIKSVKVDVPVLTIALLLLYQLIVRLVTAVLISVVILISEISWYEAATGMFSNLASVGDNFAINELALLQDT
jgi:hypothetical protein